LIFSHLKNILNLSPASTDFQKGDLDEFLKNFEVFFNGEVIGKKKYIRELSSGNQKKVGIAAALMTNPEILVLHFFQTSYLPHFKNFSLIVHIILMSIHFYCHEKLFLSKLVFHHYLSNICYLQNFDMEKNSEI